MSDAKSPMSREERLAARLRENLKRRKAQARAMETARDETARDETGGDGGAVGAGAGAAGAETPDSLETGLSNPTA